MKTNPFKLLKQSWAAFFEEAPGVGPRSYTPLKECEGAVVDILVFDVSASMEDRDYRPSRIEGAKKAGLQFVARCAETSPESVVGVVSFSTKAHCVSPPLRLREHRSRIEQSLQNLTTSSSTNAAAGVDLAAKEIGGILNAREPRMLVLTDGHSNTGGDPEKAAAKAKAQGIQIDIIGIGGSPEDVNEAQLRKMASVVDGETRYWFIESAAELTRKFEVLALREVR